jgi:GTP-binding protein
MLQDEATIQIRSGNGGPGAVSFRREKFAPEGGPDGGDGGRGGDVIFMATIHLNTLSPFIRRRHWYADNGAPGTGQNCSGKSGEDLIVSVPCGTIVKHADTGEILADLTGPDQRVIIAAGGRGGGGNSRYKSATNQTPRQAGKGQRGVELPLKLELKLIADVGIIGFPNAGKSTLLSRMSAARPKIAAYPFTTLEPQLGVVERSDRTIVLADIPGLIEGAADGVGLGHKFLRHVERCALLVHLVDASEGTAEELAARIETLNQELRRFSDLLAGKDQHIVLNKADTRQDIEELSAALAKLLGRPVMAISAVSGHGLPGLERHLLKAVPEPLGPPGL